MKEPSDYYRARIPRLLKEYDSYIKYTRPVLVRYFDEQEVDDILIEIRNEYESLIPQLPYVGGKPPFTQFIIYTALYLAIYRTVAVRGKTLEEIGEILFELGRELLQKSPSLLTRMVGGMNFSRYYLHIVQKRALESQQRKYPGNYVFEYVEGDGKSFDYGVDYLECGGCKFLAEQGASELAPYICPVDILYSEKLGWGLVRTRTLAEGADRCDFRFKKGGPTRVALPAAMQHVVERSRR